MNRLLTKRIHLGASDDAGPSRMPWKRNKKIQDLPKADINIAAALPTNDDFRTSLLMPNLSARFSMLREQDDPTSKIGKASDDSVLPTKRQSRMADFGLTGMSSVMDSSETSSSRSLTRPRPPLNEQHDSFVSDEAYENDFTNGCSMMNRARPFEGNNLFGGRQKVYKLPASSSSKSLGRALYDDDVSTTNFAKDPMDARYSPQEEDDKVAPFVSALSTPAPGRVMLAPRRDPMTAPHDYSHSPEESLGQRQASLDSTGTSDPSCEYMSTPGTSIASQPLTNGSRKLTRTGQSPLDTSGARWRFDEGDAKEPDQDEVGVEPCQIRAVSGKRSPIIGFPAATSLPDRLLGAQSSRKRSLEIDHASTDRVSSCSSSGSSEADLPTHYRPNTDSMLPIQANDAQFNDLNFEHAQDLPRHTYHQPLPPSSDYPADSASVESEQWDEESVKPPNEGSYMVSATASITSNHSDAFSVFQKAAAQIKAQHGDSLNSLPDGQNRTFFGDYGTSEDEYESDHDRRGYGRFRPSGLENIEEDPGSSRASRRAQTPLFPDVNGMQEEDETGPPTMQPQPLGVGGLVHQHLRNVSNVSSIATSVGPGDARSSHLRNTSGPYNSSLGRETSMDSLGDTAAKPLRRPFATEHGSNANSNPWDLDELDYYGSRSDSQGLIHNGEHNSAMWTNQIEDSGWQPEHRRDLSDGTLQEREAFANEIAMRQKAIQENLSRVPEVDSRSTSPMPGQSTAHRTLSILKSRPSKDSLAKQDPAPNKAMKMLGRGSSSSSNPALSRKVSGPTEQARPAPSTRVGSFSNLNPPSSQRSSSTGHNDTFGSSRQQNELQPGRPLVVTRPPMTNAGPVQSRSQSDSATSVPQAFANTSPMLGYLPSSSLTPQYSPHLSPRQSPSISQQATFQGQASSPVLPSTGGQMQSRQGASFSRGLVVSPVDTSVSPMYKNNASPASGVSPRPSPAAGSPYLATTTPPTSGASTPNTQGPITPTMPYIPSVNHGSSLRKRTVCKADISEPILISSTSNVDTVDLPPGASLKNGQDTSPPATSSTDLRRKNTKKNRLFSFGKKDGDEAEGASPETQPSRSYPTPGAPPPIPTISPPAPRSSVTSPEPHGSARSNTSLSSRSASAQGQYQAVRHMRSKDSLDEAAKVGSAPVMTEAGMF